MCGKHLFLNSESLISSFLCVLSTANIGYMAGGNSGDNLFKREVRKERFYCESHRGCFPFVLSTANIGHMAGGNSGDSCECSQAAISWPSAYSQLLRWTAVRSGAGGSAEHSEELEYVIVGIP